MNEPTSFETQKASIIAQISELSRLLGMIPSDDTITVTESISGNSMMLSNWMSDTRNSFLKLSILVGEALDIQLQ